MTEPTKPTAPTDYTFGTTTFTDSSGTANDGIVTITKGTTSTAVEVTVNNVLNSTAGDNILKLAKELTGGPAGYTGPFRINYDCTGTAFDGHVDVTAGTFQTVERLPDRDRVHDHRDTPDACAEWLLLRDADLHRDLGHCG